MGWTRRAFAASAVAGTVALAGCAGSGSDPAVPDDPATDDEPDPVWDQPVAKWGSADPLDWWARLPDLSIVNDGTDGVTAYVAIYGPNWLEAQFRETVSLRVP